MSKHYVYILVPEGAQWLYVGYTDNPQRRLKMHNEGKVKSTEQRRPYRMVIAKEYNTKEEAIAEERRLKKSSSAKKRLISKI